MKVSRSTQPNTEELAFFMLLPSIFLMDSLHWTVATILQMLRSDLLAFPNTHGFYGNPRLQIIIWSSSVNIWQEGTRDKELHLFTTLLRAVLSAVHGPGSLAEPTEESPTTSITHHSGVMLEEAQKSIWNPV